MKEQAKALALAAAGLVAAGGMPSRRTQPASTWSVPRRRWHAALARGDHESGHHRRQERRAGQISRRIDVHGRVVSGSDQRRRLLSGRRDRHDVVACGMDGVHGLQSGEPAGGIVQRGVERQQVDLVGGFVLDQRQRHGQGAVLASNNTKAGTTGVLYSAGLFSGGDRAVQSGDTLNVSYTREPVMSPQELLSALVAEIRDDPAGMGYAAFVPDAPGRIRELLNDPARASMSATRFVTALTVLAEVGPAGASALRSIERFANAEPAEDDPPEVAGLRDSAYFAMGRYAPPVLTSVTRPRRCCWTLVAIAVIAQEQADGLKGMAVQPCSRFALLTSRINATWMKNGTRRHRADRG